MGGGRVRGSGRVGGCQGGWERRIEAFVKIQFFFFFFFGGGGVGLGVRVDVNRDVKFFENSKKKKMEGGSSWGSKVWGRWVMWGMGDVNQE